MNVDRLANVRDLIINKQDINFCWDVTACHVVHYWVNKRPIHSQFEYIFVFKYQITHRASYHIAF